jgi:hypothetical protein
VPLSILGYACRSGANCRTCRTDPAWRASAALARGLDPAAIETCPDGVTLATAPEPPRPRPMPPPEDVPADFTVEQEQRRTRAGGCCGQPSRP